ncbi:MAG: porin family protein [Gemmatimonadota bacterium]
MTGRQRTRGIVRTLAVAAAVLFSTPGWAFAQGLEFSGGVNFSELNGAAIQDAARNVGVNLGVDLILPVGPIGLGVGFDWAQRGVDAADGVADPTAIDLSYIEVPINLRLPLVGAGPIRLNLIVGPRIGINTGCEISIDASPFSDCEAASEGSFEPNALDWSGTAGLGVGFALGGLAYAGTELTYVHGFSDVAPDVAADLKNRAFTLQAFLGFDLF